MQPKSLAVTWFAGETYSDVANGLMLITAVLLLFRAARWGRQS